MGGPISKDRLIILLLLVMIIFPGPGLFAKSISLNVQCGEQQYLGNAGSVSVVYCTEQVTTAGLEEQCSEPGCLVSGFSGYFHPSRWRTCFTSVDSGVDVTGAPIPKLLVEGTNSNLTEVADVVCRDFSILIPTDGYLSFEWEKLGSSLSHPSTGTTSFLFSLNGKKRDLPKGKSSYTSPFLKKGDRITFQLALEATQSVVIRDFTFFSHTQISITEVVIPPRMDLYLRDFSQLEQRTDPHRLGQPYIDTDGDEATVDDRQLLLEMASRMDISWEDFYTYDDQGNTLLIRSWSIYDPCTGNELRQEQELRCYIKAVRDR